MLAFDRKGFLVPDQDLACTLEEMRRVFVTGFPVSDTRLVIFEKFTEFCKELLLVMEAKTLSIWVNGSFVTTKIAPKDIDVVIFWNSNFIISKQVVLASLAYPESFKKHGIDAYFVFVYPEGHPKRFETVADMAYWMYQFTKTKPDHRRNSYRKGFLTLNISADEIEEIRIS